jgi:nucleoid-associated protein YgaU
VGSGREAQARRLVPEQPSEAAPPADLARTSSGEASQTYVIRRGDTLSRIAARHYGDAALYRAIYEHNRGVLRSPDALRPGQTLRLPPADALAVNPSTATASSVDAVTPDPS